MIDAVTLRGVRGLVKRAYLTAAVLTDYGLTRDPLTNAWMVRATVAAQDAYLLTQPGLVFVAPHKGGAWRWPIETFRITETAFEARLGARLQET